MNDGPAIGVCTSCRLDAEKIGGCDLQSHCRTRCIVFGIVLESSCKGRALCASYNARHMAETAVHLADHVFPPLPVRQWVAVPKRLRYFLSRDPETLGAVLRIFLRVIKARLRQRSDGTPKNPGGPLDLA